MSHDHAHHDHAQGNIRVAFWLNLGFCVVEFVGGMLTGSIAIVSDALHDLGDSFSLALAWYFEKLSRRGRAPHFTYGFRRFSLLGALINSLVLLVGSGFVIWAAVERLIDPRPVDARGMLLLALLGIAVNGAAMLRLKKGGSLGERAVALHLLEDVLGWAAVLVASVVMLFVEVPILDPLLSLLIACYILFNIYKNLRDTLRVILQGTPEDIDPLEVEQEIRGVQGVESVHDVHLWTMDGRYNILTAHVVADGRADISALKAELKKRLHASGIHHPTLEIELPGEACEMPEGCC